MMTCLRSAATLKSWRSLRQPLLMNDLKAECQNRTEARGTLKTVPRSAESRLVYVQSDVHGQAAAYLHT